MESRERRLAFYREWFLSAIGKEPFDYQLDILTRKDPVIVNKARQTGISTAFACKAVTKAALGNLKVLICSKDQNASVHILNDYCQDFLRPLIETGEIAKPETDQKALLQWRKTGGEIRSFPARPEHVRGYAANYIIFDEAAHFTAEVGLGEKMLEAVAPALSQVGGVMDMASTPNGTASMFYRVWDTAAPERKIAIPYTRCPTLKIKVEELPFGKRYHIEGLPFAFPEDSFRQEFMNDFFVGSNEAIPRTALYAALMNTDEGAWE